MRISIIFLLLLHGRWVFAAGALASQAGEQSTNWIAIGFFLLFIAITLAITYFAARRTQSANAFYTADSRISGVQNGVAISGDFLSAATLLGTSGLIFVSGFDGYVFALGAVVGWPALMFLIAEPLRNLGKYNFSDIIAYRLEDKPTRLLAACVGLVVILLYLIPQMVGAGALIQVLFGLPYGVAIVLVGVLLCLYVSFGGMLGTTWVQITKTVLLLVGGFYLLFAVLFEINFDVEGLFRQAVAMHELGESLMSPSALLSDPITTISFGLTIVFGVCGLPHILMRFFTVPNAREARKSIFVAAVIIGVFQVIMLVLGFAAIVFVAGQPEFYADDGHLLGGQNMAVIHLAKALGGDIFLGFISAVAFATILAVVAGLTIAAASAIVNDIYISVIKSGRASDADALRVSKISPFFIGIVAVLFGFAFQHQNVVVMATVAISVAAGVNFPLLLLAIYWRGLTTRGALTGGVIGLLTSVAMVVTSPMVWVDVLGNPEPLHPYRYATLFSLTATLLFSWLGSASDRSARAGRERAAFASQFRRSMLGREDGGDALATAHRPD